MDCFENFGNVCFSHPEQRNDVAVHPELKPRDLTSSEGGVLFVLAWEPEETYAIALAKKLRSRAPSKAALAAWWAAHSDGTDEWSKANFMSVLRADLGAEQRSLVAFWDHVIGEDETALSLANLETFVMQHYVASSRTLLQSDPAQDSETLLRIAAGEMVVSDGPEIELASGVMRRKVRYHGHDGYVTLQDFRETWPALRYAQQPGPTEDIDHILGMSDRDLASRVEQEDAKLDQRVLAPTSAAKAKQRLKRAPAVKASAEKVAKGRVLKKRPAAEALVPKSSFLRLVCDVSQELIEKRESEISPGVPLDRHRLEQVRFEKSALVCLQLASEWYVTDVMSDCAALAAHRKCVTVTPSDLKLCERMGRLVLGPQGLC